MLNLIRTFTLFTTLLILVSMITEIDAANSCDGCRFAFNYTAKDLLTNHQTLQRFLRDVMYWEGKIQLNNIGVTYPSALTLDGHRLEVVTGEPLGEPHQFSAPSKECIHVGLLALAVGGDEYAQRWVLSATTSSSEELEQVMQSPSGSSLAVAEAATLLHKKVLSYAVFRSAFPAYGHFMPWFTVYPNQTITPTSDWVNRVPALDNGELAWSAIAAASALRMAGFNETASLWDELWQGMVRDSIPVFYDGNGGIRCVTDIANMTDPTYPLNPANYKAETSPGQPPCYLDDPYEGELMAVLMDLYVNWTAYGYPETERELIWLRKRAKLQSVDLVINSTTSITVQRGWWFSAHEQWKYMMAPYVDVEINRRVFYNGERARSWWSAIKGIAGLYASVNGLSPNDTYNYPYVSDCGIQPIAFEPITNKQIVTPYGSFPMMLATSQPPLPEAVVWYWTMISGPRMQNCFGSTEASNITGYDVSPLVTWDSKSTTAMAMLGGVVEHTRRVLKETNTYDRFVYVIDREWSRVFKKLEGESLSFQLPTASIPLPKGVPQDFSSCTASNSKSWTRNGAHSQHNKQH